MTKIHKTTGFKTIQKNLRPLFLKYPKCAGECTQKNSYGECEVITFMVPHACNLSTWEDQTG